MSLFDQYPIIKRLLHNAYLASERDLLTLLYVFPDYKKYVKYIKLTRNFEITQDMPILKYLDMSKYEYPWSKDIIANDYILLSLETYNNLTYLDCSNNTYIKIIPKLINLKTLICNKCINIQDLNSLAETSPRLEYLSCRGCERITDLNALTSLTYLNCSTYFINRKYITGGNTINNITNFNGLINLKHLSCNSCNNVNSLNNLKHLTYLSCRDCPNINITDIQQEITNKLVYLDCSKSRKNMYFHKYINLENFKSLTYLNCENSCITNISYLTNLETLICKCINYLDLILLIKLKHLTCTEYNNNTLPILPELISLELHNVEQTLELPLLLKLEDLTCVECNIIKLPDYPNLKNLTCIKCQIDEIPEFANLVNLIIKTCYLYNYEFTGLPKFPKLEYLEYCGLNTDDLNLYTLPCLKKLVCRDIINVNILLVMPKLIKIKCVDCQNVNIPTLPELIKITCNNCNMNLQILPKLRTFNYDIDCTLNSRILKKMPNLRSVNGEGFNNPYTH